MPNKDMEEAPEQRGLYIIWRAAVFNPNLSQSELSPGMAALRNGDEVPRSVAYSRTMKPRAEGT